MKNAATALPLALAAAAVLGAAAGPASALEPDTVPPGFSVKISAPAKTPRAGVPVIVTASGKVPPPAQRPFLTWMAAAVFLKAHVSTCPANGNVAVNMAPATGGRTLAIAAREDADSAGRFSIPLGFTPLKAQKFLVCVYSQNENGFTLATAHRTIDVHKAKKR